MTTASLQPRTRQVPRLSITFEGKGRTKQSMRDECDINKLMEKFRKTGTQPPQNHFPAQYGDFSNVDDYQTAVNQVHDALDAFSELPSNIRNRFQNDPKLLIEFMSEPGNLEEAIELGLAPKPEPKPKPPAPAPPVVETPPAPPGD